MYIKKVELNARRETGFTPGWGQFVYPAAFLQLTLECPVCKAAGVHNMEHFHIGSSTEAERRNRQFLAALKDFCCEKCGVSSKMPQQDREKVLAHLTEEAMADLRKRSKELIRSIEMERKGVA